jgi:cyanate lyase
MLQFLSGPSERQQLVSRLLDAKHQSGLSFQDIASRLDYTNLYVAQLLLNQVYYA